MSISAVCIHDRRVDARQYSDAVVDSLVAAVNRYTAAPDNGPALVLIGYSGGGTLAVLMAAHLPSMRASSHLGKSSQRGKCPPPAAQRAPRHGAGANAHW